MRQYLKDKINELATKGKNRNIRGLCKGINESESFLKHYLVKDENSDMLADSHNNLNRWKNHFY
jgi:hypothetical protein